MKLIIEVTEGYYKHLKDKKYSRKATVSDATILDGIPYEERSQGDWIPVEEKLPEGKIDPMTNDFELVLCSTVWEVVRPYKFGKPIGHDKAPFLEWSWCNG